MKSTELKVCLLIPFAILCHSGVKGKMNASGFYSPGIMCENIDPGEGRLGKSIEKDSLESKHEKGHLRLIWFKAKTA